MRTLLLLSVCLLSACASTVPQAPPANPEFARTPGADPVAASGNARKGRRAALWTGIGFALYAIYEANNDDDYLSPVPVSSCLSLKCW